MHRRLIPPIALTVALASALPAQAAPVRDPAASAAAKVKTRTTKLKDSYFSPSSITARKKVRLRFLWRGRLAHNLVGRRIPRRYARARVRYRMLTRTYGRGTYRFSCTIHPGMDLRLRVK